MYLFTSLYVNCNEVVVVFCSIFFMNILVNFDKCKNGKRVTRASVELATSCYLGRCKGDVILSGFRRGHWAGLRLRHWVAWAKPYAGYVTTLIWMSMKHAYCIDVCRNSSVSRVAAKIAGGSGLETLFSHTFSICWTFTKIDVINSTKYYMKIYI